MRNTDYIGSEAVENYGVSWIPYRHRFYSPKLCNQPTQYLCQSACAVQLLFDNHGVNYEINEFFRETLQANPIPKLTLTSVRNALNKILNADFYKVVYPIDYQLAFFQQRIHHGKVWIASVRESIEAKHGHTLLVCGLTPNRSIKVFDPWGRGPQSGVGTLGILTQSTFFTIWENSNYGALFTDH